MASIFGLRAIQAYVASCCTTRSKASGPPQQPTALFAIISRFKHLKLATARLQTVENRLQHDDFFVCVASRGRRHGSVITIWFRDEEGNAISYSQWQKMHETPTDFVVLSSRVRVSCTNGNVAPGMPTLVCFVLICNIVQCTMYMSCDCILLCTVLVCSTDITTYIRYAASFV